MRPSGRTGGDEGIRTLDELLAHTPLAGERLRPLGHVSKRGISELRGSVQAPNGFIGNLDALGWAWLSIEVLLSLQL